MDLACDDGNKINGDGCSSNCTEESSYDCFDEAPKGRSRCIYNQNIQINLVCIYKMDEPNVLEIIIKFDPYV